MRQVFLDKNLVTVKEVCRPNLGDNALLVSVHYSFISPETEELTAQNTHQSLEGLTKNIVKTLDSLAYTNIINIKSSVDKSIIQSLGYSCCGQVISIGKNIKNFRPGDYVACMGVGIANHADFVCVPEDRAVKITNLDILPQASTIALGTRALEIFLQSKASLGDTVCVIGLETLGLLIMQLAAAAGCQVLGIDYSDQKVIQAKKSGPYKLFKFSDPSLIDDILHHTHYKGVSTVIITHPVESTDEKKICSLVQDRGKIVITDNTHFKFTHFWSDQKEIHLLLTRKSSQQANKEEQLKCMKSFINLLEQKTITIESFINNYYPLERVQQAYAQLKHPEATGIILNYLPKNTEILDNNPIIEKQEPSSLKNAPIRVAFIGMDSYTEKHILPFLSKTNNLEINAIIDSDITRSLTIAKKYHNAHIISNEQELLDKNICEAIVLNTVDNYETEKILTLLASGKALFIQNFMAHNQEQLKKLKNFLHKNPSSKFCINYKRSFAPFIQKIKDATQKRNTPLMIHYRLNNPANRNSNSDAGNDAGSIINQAGHIIDLFCFLTEANPIAVSVESLNSSHDKIFPTDNFCAHISFDDGSICSIMFTCIGHHSSGQERMELFFDSKTIVMNDFISLTGYGLPKSFNEKVFTPDYGQEHILKKFFKKITEDNTPLISFDRLCTVAQISLTIDQLACQGGGIQ